MKTRSTPSSFSTCRPGPEGLRQHNRQNHNRQHNRQDDQQETRPLPRILLIPTRRSQLDIRPSRIIPHIFDVRANDIELISLFVNHVCDVPEKFVEFADGLLDVADFGFAFDDEAFLEVDFVLRGEAELFLLLELLLLLTTLGTAAGAA